MTRHHAVRAYRTAQATAAPSDLSARIVGAVLVLASAVAMVQLVRWFHNGGGL
jgi:hypothetical protein